MSNKTLDTRQGHWILAKVGKKVLRPGGKELTLKMMDNLVCLSVMFPTIISINFVI